MTNETKSTVSYKDTLNLPTTRFPIRPNHAVDDPALSARWQREDLYQKTFDLHKGSEKFILHDGPPYANGHIHLGHAYNKILKDIITKARRMAGFHVPVTPGWDCHGLPIEIKVTKENPGLTGLALKKACRDYATEWITIQRDEFKKLGVLMNWDHPYLTMNPSYEAATIRAFGEFVSQGYIEKKKKTVPWCASCQTVLATAEIEYQERKDPSIYVKFPLLAQARADLFGDHAVHEISLLVWTTTPWTLPLNRAVLIKPDAEYQLVKLNEQYLIIGKPLVAKIAELAKGTPELIVEFKAEQLKGAFAQHPFIPTLQVPIILDDSVSLADGTAAVHCAPGCGPEDYEVARKNNLEIFSPISTSGAYTPGIAPVELEGMPVTDGQIWVIKQLAANGNLFFKNSIKHSYPHCWRCHNGLIFRATSQWFCNLAHGNLKNAALQALEKIAFLPERSKNYLKATIEGRLEWCLSRQRQWGVPIPAVVCTACNEAIITNELVQFVADRVQKQGIEYWDEVTVAQLPFTFKCKCGSQAFTKERDILDVWFDSGISHYAVLRNNPELAFPADLYAEGIDQHRGWFQSSLLTALVLEKSAPMKSILTHGFTVDQAGHKMSKSIGNVISPDELVAQLGTDGLRLWASSIDYTGDAIVSRDLLANVAESYRKIRNTARFLLSNLYDFESNKDAVPLHEMSVIDHYALEQLFFLNHAVRQAYHEADLTAVFHKLSDYCAKELSSFYLDIIKDRLYTGKADGKDRRSAQTVCYHILDTLTRLAAPILSFAAEYISDEYQKDKKVSIHLQPFNDLLFIWESLLDRSDSTVPGIAWFPFEGRAAQAADAITQMSFLAERKVQWELIHEIRSAILKSLEREREKDLIKHSLEARITVAFKLDAQKMAILNDLIDELRTHGQTFEQFLKELVIVSQVAIISQEGALGQSELPGLYVSVEHAYGNKCPRCWQWDQADHVDHLCSRCIIIVKDVVRR